MLKKFENFNKGTFYESDLSNLLGKVSDGSITELEIERLNNIADYKNFYQELKQWLQYQFEIFSQFNLEDIEDRMLEYFDQIPDWTPYCMFSLSDKNTSLGIYLERITEEKYFNETLSRVISDIKYKCNNKYLGKNSIEHYLGSVSATLHVELNHMNKSSYNKPYNLLDVERLVSEIENKLSRIYGFKKCPHYQEHMLNRKYDPNIDTYDHSFKMKLD